MAKLAAIRLKDGRKASVTFLSPKDDVREILRFINSFIGEKAFLIHDRKYSLKEEKEWKGSSLKAIGKGEYYYLIARVDGKIAGTSDARRGRFKERDNVSLGIAIAKGYRGVGLGEALLRLNIRLAKKRMKPENIFLGVFAPNRPARSLYWKVGFREFAVFPKWLLHDGKYVDHVFMRLKK